LWVSLVKDCLDGGWLDDIPADLDALAIDELMAVADRVEGLTVTAGVPDIFKWNRGAKDVYFRELLLTWHVPWEHRPTMAGALQVWKSRAPACLLLGCVMARTVWATASGGGT
jgi:hypothetical protein